MLKFCQLLLRHTSPDAVIATLERLGAVRWDRDAHWFFPSTSDPRIAFHLHVRREEDGRRLGLPTIFRLVHDFNWDRAESFPSTVAGALGIPFADAETLVADADVLVAAYTRDKMAACRTLPHMVRALLQSHDGIAYDRAYQRGAWTSEEVRAGRAEALEPPPAPSIAEEYERSDAVFVGEVVAEQRVQRSTDTPAGVLYTLNVDEVLRGNLPETMRVVADQFPMAVGKQYLLFVSYVRGRPVVDPCGNSSSVPAAPDALATARELNHKHG